VTACRRLLSHVVWAVGATLAVARGQETPAAAPPFVMTPEIAALVATLPAWSTMANVETGVGYKDNLLLSHADEEASGFARGTVNAMASHLRLGDRTDYSFGFTAEGTRYFSGTSVNHEANAFALAKWRYHLDDVFKFNLDLKGYYEDEIFDVSDTDVQRVVAQLKVAGVIAGPTLRWNFRPWVWIETSGDGKRESYRESLYNNKVAEGTARLGWKPGARFEASIAGTERQRDYDTHPQYSVSGRALDGTHLENTEREGEARGDVTWDAHAHWKTATRLRVLHFTDNGSGYFNYHERKIDCDLDWENGAWLVHTEGEAGRREYEVQTVGLGLAPPPRVRDEFSAKVRVERKLNERWTLYAEYNWERNRCNDPIASYNMNEGLLGVRWSWEK
jgi:hypothetical protein